jgi:hypothetical protein
MTVARETRRLNTITVLGAAALAAFAAACQDSSVDPARLGALESRLSQAEAKIDTLEDEQQIKNLTRAYGYYLDKGLWSHVVDLFAAEAVVEIQQRGVYVGRAGVRNLFEGVLGNGVGAADGLRDGRVFNHMILQGVVHTDGDRARGRWRAFIQVGVLDAAAIWAEGVYENDYVKEDGVWKFGSLSWWPTYYTDFDEGWAEQSVSCDRPTNLSETYPPNRPPSNDYQPYPNFYVPPFHFSNPVSGRPVEPTPIGEGGLSISPCNADPGTE